MLQRFFALCALALLFSCGAEQSEYLKSIESHRANKDLEYKTGENTPMPEDLLKEFHGLKYYPVSDKYKVMARVERVKDAEPFMVPTSNGQQKPFVKWANLHFELDGKPIVAGIYQNVKYMNMPEYKDYLFLMFKDHTNGDNTYGGGRFIDVKKPKEGEMLEIDFNLCYNPLCAYGGSWACPYPPEENHLEVAIPAGEKAYLKQGHH